MASFLDITLTLQDPDDPHGHSAHARQRDATSWDVKYYRGDEQVSTGGISTPPPHAPPVATLMCTLRQLRAEAGSCTGWEITRGAPGSGSEVAVDDLIGFLRARLDEREAKAKAALPGPWIVEEHAYETAVTSDGGQIVASVDGLRDGWHIADNDPEFVLADVAAKRRIIDLYAEARQNAVDYREDYTLAGDRPWSAKAEHLDPVVRLFARQYANHPDYREEWKP